MRTKLSFLFLFTITLNGFAQDGIEIKLDGQSIDISGQTHTMVAPSHEIFDVLFDVYNNTGEPKDWVITRLKVDVPMGWQDGLCWGHATDPFGGTCFSSTQMNANPWTSPASQAVLFTINDGEYGKMKPQINPDDWVSGQAHYRYYISEPGMAYADSVDLIVDFTASLKPENEVFTISITPNPTSQDLYISLSSGTADFKIVNSFGGTVMNGTVQKEKKIDVSSFKNGIYFVRIETQDNKSLTRKLIITK